MDNRMIDYVVVVRTADWIFSHTRLVDHRTLRLQHDEADRDKARDDITDEFHFTERDDDPPDYDRLVPASLLLIPPHLTLTPETKGVIHLIAKQKYPDGDEPEVTATAFSFEHRVRHMFEPNYNPDVLRDLVDRMYRVQAAGVDK